MRADRLIATLLVLQRRTRVTAAELATELEVSERTARRDLEALMMAGFPLYSERGRGGGWRLLGGGRTDLSGLTATEARALFLAAGPAAAAAPELRSALRKLAGALPAPFRPTAEGAASAVVLDPAGWGRPGRSAQPPFLAPLQAAAADGEQIRLGYLDRHGSASERLVNPLGLVLKGTAWYLVADTSDGRRTFRVSRVRSVEPTGERSGRPAGFDLAEAWREVVEQVDAFRARAEVVARVAPQCLPALEWIFEQKVARGEPSTNGRVEVTIRGRDAEQVARQLAGFGALVEVRAPPEARRQLALIAEQLGALYAGEPPAVEVARKEATGSRKEATGSGEEATGSGEETAGSGEDATRSRKEARGSGEDATR